MLIRRPILIPSSTTLLVDPKGNPHPLVLNKTLISVAWQISGRDYLSREFLRKQPSLLPSKEGKALWEITNRPGRSGLAGVTMESLSISMPCEYKEMLLYKTTGLHRSAISAYHVHVDDNPIGQHPLCALFCLVYLTRALHSQNTCLYGMSKKFQILLNQHGGSR